MTSLIERIRASDRDDEGSAIILAIVFVFGVSLALWALVSFTGAALLNSGNLRAQRATEYSADSATEMAIQAVRYRPSSYSTTASCLGTSSVTFNNVAMQVMCSGSLVSGLPQSGSGSIPTLTTASSTTLFTSSVTASFYLGWEITDPIASGGKNVIPTGTTITAENNSTNIVTMSKSASAIEASDVIVVTPPVTRTINFYTCTTSVSSCTSSTATVVAEVEFNDVKSDGTYACSSSTSQTCGEGMTVEQWTVKSANG